jgi:phospholipid-translocating ATPase
MELRLQQAEFEASRFRSNVEVDAPTTKIYRFHGTVVHPSGERVPVGSDNLLLRDCVLKNTDFVEGIVVYAGESDRTSN